MSKGTTRVPTLSCYRDDEWKRVRVASGTELLALWPLESGYLFPFREFERADGQAEALYGRLQLRLHPFFGAKPAVAVLRVVGGGPLEAAASVRWNNPAFGRGGGTMMRLANTDRLELVEIMRLAADTTIADAADHTAVVALGDELRSFTTYLAPLGACRVTLTWRDDGLSAVSISGRPVGRSWREWSHRSGADHADAHGRALAAWLESGGHPAGGSIGLFRDPHNHCGSIEVSFRETIPETVAHERKRAAEDVATS